MKDVIIPHRLRTLNGGLSAIKLERRFGPLEMMDVMVDAGDGSQSSEYRGVLSALTQPLITVAVINARCLLEFLGLGVNSKSRPPTLNVSCKARRQGDVGIENFSDPTGKLLNALTPTFAAAILGRAADFHSLDSAWAATYTIANQRLAHSTEDEILDKRNMDDRMGMAFETIPELVCRAFYDKLGGIRPILK